MVAATRWNGNRNKRPEWPQVPIRQAETDPLPPFTAADTAWAFFGGLVIAWCGVWLGFGIHAGWAAWEWIF